VVGKPRVLVCDEICDSLDSGARASLLGALERLAVRGTQLLYTTHREDELLPILTHRLCLDGGRIVSAEPISRTFERLEAQLPRAPGLGVAPVTPSRSRVPSRPGYGPRGANGSRRLPRLRIDIRAANVYLEQRQALFDVTWQIREGQHWAVLGPNGSGKTTLLKLIVGDLHPSLGGRVRRFEFTSKNTIWEVKQKMGWVSPELQSHYRESLSGAQVIGSGFHSSVGLVQPLTRAQWRRVEEVVECLGLQELAGRNTLTLSYGEFRKILIARALVQRPELLVCDEPYDGLDTASRAAVARILGQVAGQGTGLVIVTHHLGELPPCTTHLAAIESGRLVFQGPISDH
jgi:molybdate transport system ATP-binding protein